jgi:hypothetical protein
MLTIFLAAVALLCAGMFISSAAKQDRKGMLAMGLAFIGSALPLATRLFYSM